MPAFGNSIHSGEELLQVTRVTMLNAGLLSDPETRPHMKFTDGIAGLLSR
jgi:hypothetical protein